jgi:hypothetical protein
VSTKTITKIAALYPSLLLLLFLTGCASTHKQAKPVKFLTLPTWFTAPSNKEMNCVPVRLRMKSPAHLNAFSRKYKLPGWIIYGSVRSLGTKELTVKGTYRAFAKTKPDQTEEVLVDDINYDVSISGIDSTLQRISKECIIAENETKRLEVLASHAVRQFGTYALFTLKPNVTSNKNPSKEPEPDDTQVEEFRTDTPIEAIDVGWSETGTHYNTTMTGKIEYNDPFYSFMRTEENAIHEISKNIIIKFIRMRRKESITTVSSSTTSEEIEIKIRGLHVVRRKADLSSNTCSVTITVPKNGVTLL